MKRMRIAASSRDAALRAQHRAIQEALYAPNSAEEEHAAELAQGLEAAINADPLAEVTASGHGTDADAGEYLQAETDAEANQE
jgi:DNA-directed RNA polymerase subunit beta'